MNKNKKFLVINTILITILMILSFAITSFADIEFGITEEDTPQLNDLKATIVGNVITEANYQHKGRPFSGGSGNTVSEAAEGKDTDTDAYVGEGDSRSIDDLLDFLNSKTFDAGSNSTKSTGLTALEKFSSLFCIRHNQPIGKYHAYLERNHGEQVDISDYTELPNSYTAIPDAYRKDFIENKSSEAPSDEFRKQGEKGNRRDTDVKYTNQGYTNLFKINNGYNTHYTNVFSYAVTFSQKADGVTYNSEQAQLGIWAVVGTGGRGDPVVGVIDNTDEDTTIDEDNNEENNGTSVSDPSLITDSELWMAGAALDEYEDLLTKDIAGDELARHNAAVVGTDKKLRNKPEVTLYSNSSSDEFVGQTGEKAGTIEDSTGTTIFTENGAEYYKIGPFKMSNYALASAKDVNGENYIEKFSGSDEKIKVFKDMLGGIIYGEVKFKDDGDNVTTTLPIGKVADSEHVQIVYSDMKGNAIYTEEEFKNFEISANYIRTPLITDDEPYVYPYPNSTFYVVVRKDACGENTVKLADMMFEYRQTKTDGHGWVITSEFIRTEWAINVDDATRSECTYSCTVCEHANMGYTESKYADADGTTKHVYYCSEYDTGTEYCSKGVEGSHYHCNSECRSSCGHTHNNCDNGDGDTDTTDGCTHSHNYLSSDELYYCSHGYNSGIHHEDYDGGKGLDTEYCAEKTICQHNHEKCYQAYWEKTAGPTHMTGQPFLAVHDAQVWVIKTPVTSELDVRMTTDVSINKYIYDVEHAASDTLTNSKHDSTQAATDEKSAFDELAKGNNPTYVEVGDTVTYHIDLKNAQAQDVMVRIRDILPNGTELVSVKNAAEYTDENADAIEYTDVSTFYKTETIDGIDVKYLDGAFFTTKWIKVGGGSTTKIEVKIKVVKVVNDGTEAGSTSWENKATIITRNEGHLGYPDKTITSVDYVRTDIDERPGPVVNLSEKLESSDWYKLKEYKASVYKVVSAYNEEVTKDNNNNPMNENNMQITNEVNNPGMFITDGATGKEKYTRYSYTEEQKESTPIFVEKDETLSYSIIVANEAEDKVNETYPFLTAKATQVRPTQVTDVLQTGLYLLADSNGKYQVTATLYNQDGTVNTNYDPLGSVAVKVNKVKTDDFGTEYTFEIGNETILNPGDYIVYTVNVGVEQSNMYLYSLKNSAELTKLTNINHMVAGFPIYIKDGTSDINVGQEKSSDYVRMKDLVISGRVWLDRDKDGLMNLDASKAFEGTIDVEAETSSNIQYNTEYEKSFANLTVKLYQVGAEGDTCIRETKTDENGIFTFGRNDNLDWLPGEYNITPDGFVTESEQRIPKATNKDLQTKKYTEESEYISYYVEYEYDGVLYKSTEIYAERSNIDSATGEINENYVIDSNAAELKAVREEYNKKFEVISYNVAYDETKADDPLVGTSTELKFDKEPHESYLIIDNDKRLTTARSFVKSPDYADTDYLWLEFTADRFDLPETNYLKYINLGLQEREEIDISLMKDIYEVKTTINGEEMIYGFDQLEAEGPNALNGDIGDATGTYLKDYVIKEPYGITLYEEDFKYRYENYQNTEVQTYKGPESELNVEITYKITIDSKHIEEDDINKGTDEEQKLITRVHEILDLYDENFMEVAFDDKGEMKPDNAINVKEKYQEVVNAGTEYEETVELLRNKSIQIAEAWCYDRNGNKVELTLTSNSNYSAKVNDFTADGYNKLYITGMGDIEIAEGEKLDIFVKYIVDKDDTLTLEIEDEDTLTSKEITLERTLEILEKSDNQYKWTRQSTDESGNVTTETSDVIESIAQVDAYSIWYEEKYIDENGEEKIRAGKPASIVDCDSNAGNIGIVSNTDMDSADNTGLYEDTVYKTGIEFSVPNTPPTPPPPPGDDPKIIRKMTGFVWDDARSEEESGQYLGNGEYNTSDSKHDDAKNNEAVRENYVFYDEDNNRIYKTEDTDILVRNAKVEYIEIIPIVENGQVKYYEDKIDGTAWNAVQNTRSGEDGKFELTGYIPGYYVVRYTYGDKGETPTDAYTYDADQNLIVLEDAQDMLVFNGQDYKSTKYNDVTEGVAAGNNYYNEILLGLEEENKSDARDDELKRLETISYSEVMVNGIAEILKGYTNGTLRTDDDGNVIDGNYITPNNFTKNSDTDLATLTENTYMYADTTKFYVKPEKLDKLTTVTSPTAVISYNDKTSTEGGILYEEINKIKFEDTAENVRLFEIKNLDFGVEYRPESQISLNKRISKITLTPSGDDKTPLVKLVFDVDYTVTGDTVRTNVINANESIGEENVQFISNKYKNFGLYDIDSELEKKQGFVFINIDEDILQGCTLEIEYEFTAGNYGEIDRINSNLDAIRFKQNADALAYETFFYEDDQSNKDYKASRTAANILRDMYGVEYVEFAKDETTGEEIRNNPNYKTYYPEIKYTTKIKKAYVATDNGTTVSETGYYGKYLSEFYYTGVEGEKDVISTIKFDKILDYVDTDLVFKSDENLQKLEDNTLWSTTSSKELKDDGYIKPSLFIDDNIYGQRLISPLGGLYDTYPEGTQDTDGNNVPITSNLITSVTDRVKDSDEYANPEEDPTINVDISRFLKPEEKATVNLTAYKVIAAETFEEDMSYENIAEIIQFTTLTGRRTNYATTIGNADMRPYESLTPEEKNLRGPQPTESSEEYHESTKESDTSAVEEVTLKPPTGLGKIENIIRDTVEVAGKGIGITATTVALVFGGIVLVQFIIRKVRKRRIK